MARRKKAGQARVSHILLIGWRLFVVLTSGVMLHERNAHMPNHAKRRSGIFGRLSKENYRARDRSIGIR